MMRKITGILLVILIFFGSCSTAPETAGFEYSPPVEEWLDAFEAGCLSGEQFLTLIKGGFEVQKMEALKIMALRYGQQGK